MRQAKRRSAKVWPSRLRAEPEGNSAKRMIRSQNTGDGVLLLDSH